MWYGTVATCTVVFDGRFSLRLSLRALQPDGLVLSMLSANYGASQYLIVYLRRGRIVVSMTSSSRAHNTRRVTSRHRYDDANWWQVGLHNGVFIFQL